MKTLISIKSILLILIFTLIGCENTNSKVCNYNSEWRDKNGVDSCNYYPESELCSRIVGKLVIKSRLHKNSLENGVFEGGISSRWLKIDKDSIKYYKPSGEIADRGSCNCSDGELKIVWEKGLNLPVNAQVYFNSSDLVELRYYDYPFSFNTLDYDSSKGKTNPTKITGLME